MSGSIIKYFCTIFGSLYAYIHILNLKTTKVYYSLNFFTMLLLTPLVYLTRTYLSMFTIPILVLLLASYFGIIYRQNFSLSLRISTIAVGLNYALFPLGALLFSPIAYAIYTIYYGAYSYEQISLVFAIGSSVFQLILVFILFSIKRFRHGIPNIENMKVADIFIYGSLIIMLISSIFFYQSNTAFLLAAVLVFFTLAFGIVIYLWWRQHITNTYIRKSMQRDLDVAEHTIEEQKTEIEKLSKIIHKDNKLLSALELSVQELQASPNSEHSMHLLKELEFLSSERKDVLSVYEGENASLPKTDVFSIDMIIRYLHKRAYESGIQFDVAIMGNVRHFISEIVDEHDLGTLLSDLGENAIHATSKSANRQILLTIGVSDKYYFIDMCDNGAPFSQKVIENLGQRRYTTRKSEGGSGIGLMTTMEILKKSNASFELEELDNNSLYTKRIRAVWDKKSEIRIISAKAHLYDANSVRKDILYIPTAN